MRAILLVAPVLLLVGAHAAPVPAENDDKKEERLSALPDRDAICNNGSTVRVKLLEEKLTLKTPYGKLVIPASKIKRIDCATRVTPAVAKKIELAIRGLASDDAKVRDAATDILAKLKTKAWPALLKLENDKDAEVQRRIKKLLEDLRNTMSEEEQEVRESDVVHTDDSKIAGEIEGTAFKVDTQQFGEVPLRLADLRSLRLHNEETEEKAVAGVLPDPGNMGTYQGQIGKVLVFRVTGAVGGSLWGTNIYTTDSTLAMAAVHAGVLKPGETKNVKVKILPARAGFIGSVQNGVASAAYLNVYPGAYEILKGRK